MDYSMAVSVASALVSSLFDYVNSVLVGCPHSPFPASAACIC